MDEAPPLPIGEAHTPPPLLGTQSNLRIILHECQPPSPVRAVELPATITQRAKVPQAAVVSEYSGIILPLPGLDAGSSPGIPPPLAVTAGRHVRRGRPRRADPRQTVADKHAEHGAFVARLMIQTAFRSYQGDQRKLYAEASREPQMCRTIVNLQNARLHRNRAQPRADAAAPARRAGQPHPDSPSAHAGRRGAGHRVPRLTGELEYHRRDPQRHWRSLTGPDAGPGAPGSPSAFRPGFLLDGERSNDASSPCCHSPASPSQD